MTDYNTVSLQGEIMQIAETFTTVIICPRCGSRDFKEVDCGPDSYDDDISYTSDICNSCGLWLDGWIDKWLVDCEFWQESEDCEEYDHANPDHAI